MPTLKITTSVIPDGVRVAVSGEANAMTFTRLDTEMTRIARQAPRRVVVDLSGLTFISSTAMGALLKLRAALAGNSGTLRITGANPIITEAFHRAKLDRIFQFADVIEADPAARAD